MRGCRLARFRDYLLLVIGALALLVVLLLSLSLWKYQAVVETIFQFWTLEIIVAAAALAIACGVLYVFLSPPCQERPDRRIRTSEDDSTLGRHPSGGSD